MADRPIPTILYSGVRGYPEYAETFGEEEADRLLGEHAATIRAVVAEHAGKLAPAPADAVLAGFPTTDAALACAVDVQRRLQAGGGQLRVSIGIHPGNAAEPRQVDNPVDRAACICSVAGPGRILASDAARTAGSDEAGHVWFEPGFHAITGFAEPQLVYELDWKPPAAPAAEPEPEVLEGEVLDAADAAEAGEPPVAAAVPPAPPAQPPLTAPAPTPTAAAARKPRSVVLAGVSALALAGGVLTLLPGLAALPAAPVSTLAAPEAPTDAAPPHALTLLRQDDFSVPSQSLFPRPRPAVDTDLLASGAPANVPFSHSFESGWMVLHVTGPYPPASGPHDFVGAQVEAQQHLSSGFAVEFTAEVRHGRAGAWVGVHHRLDAGGSLRVAVQPASGAYRLLWQSAGGGWSPLATGVSSAFNPSGPDRLRVELRDGTVTLLVNGSPLAHAPLPNGVDAAGTLQVAAYVLGAPMDDQTDVAIDDVALYGEG